MSLAAVLVFCFLHKISFARLDKIPPASPSVLSEPHGNIVLRPADRSQAFIGKCCKSEAEAEIQAAMSDTYRIFYRLRALQYLLLSDFVRRFRSLGSTCSSLLVFLSCSRPFLRFTFKLEFQKEGIHSPHIRTLLVRFSQHVPAYSLHLKLYQKLLPHLRLGSL